MSRGPRPTLLGIIGLLIVTLVVAAVLAVATAILFPDWPPIVQMALPTELALAGAVAWSVSRSGRPWREALGLRPFRKSYLAPLLLVLVGAVTVFSEIYLVIQRIAPVPDAFERMLRDLMRIDGPVDLVATAAVAVLAAPALEEALFRGSLLQGLTRARGPRAATMWTAAFFALYHLYNPWQVVPTFFLGLVLAWVVLSTRSLLAGIVLHAAFNAVSLAIFAAPISQREPEPEQVPWVVAAIFGLLILGSLAFLGGMSWLERETGGGTYAEPPEPEPVDDEPATRAGPFAARG